MKNSQAILFSQILNSLFLYFGEGKENKGENHQMCLKIIEVDEIEPAQIQKGNKGGLEELEASSELETPCRGSSR